MGKGKGKGIGIGIGIGIGMGKRVGVGLRRMENYLKFISTGFALIVFTIMLASCRNDGNDAVRERQASSLKKELIEANKHVVRTEDEQIEDLLKRYKWDVSVSETGLRYVIDDPGTGFTPKEGNSVTLNYKVSLITGDPVYSSDEDGPMSFVVGKSDVIAGLQEGVMMLGEGGKARLIIPSHLGYGLIGDHNKINQKATLIYRIEILDIN